MQGLNKPVFISALFGGLIGGVHVGAITLILLSNHLTKAEKTAILKQPGMDIINGYRCPSGETKRIILNGKEDGYSLEGYEPAKMHERLLAHEKYRDTEKITTDYDVKGMDKQFWDFMEVPANISSGIFVIGITSLTNDGNDIVSVGNLFDLDYSHTIRPKNATVSKLQDLGMTIGWQQKNDIFFGELEDIKLFREPKDPSETSTLLQYIQLGQEQESATSILDIMAEDDVQVDFTALAVCEQPTNNKGITLSEYTGYKDKFPNISYLSCDDDPTQKACNPFVGDTLCSASLPIACFKDERLKIPDEIASFGNLKKHWSGGRLSYTQAVQGDRFETIAQANAFCTAQFGENWRVLSWHESSFNNVTMYTKIRRPGQRSWIDIKDQPYGTCWER